MKIIIVRLITFCLALQFFSCMPSRIVRPYEKNQKSVDIHLGGSLIKFGGATIPLPLTSITYAQGITDKVTLFGSLHTTSLLYGVFQTDIGACYGLYYNEKLRLGFSVTPAVNIAVDRWEGKFKLWPQLDANMYWDIKSKKSFVYLGVSNWFELSNSAPHDQQQNNRWLVNPQIGITHVRKKWNYSFEAKYLVPTIENKPNAVDYKGINGKGAVGVYFSFTRKF